MSAKILATVSETQSQYRKKEIKRTSPRDSLQIIVLRSANVYFKAKTGERKSNLAQLDPPVLCLWAAANKVNLHNLPGI